MRCSWSHDREERFTNVDGTLVLSGLASLVLRGEGSPVERAAGVFVAKVGEFYSTLFTSVETVKTGGGCRAGNKKRLEQHCKVRSVKSKSIRNDSVNEG